MVWNKDNATGRMFQIIPETVGQFVCLDKNKDEVYEGDKVMWKQPDETIAEIEGEYEELEAAVAGGFWIYDVEGSTFAAVDHFEDEDIELLKD